MQDFTNQKIINGIKYFVKNTFKVGRTKLFKLLYFWDFIHFKMYGFSVTGYIYHTFPFGPVPRELYEQIREESLPDQFNSEIKIVEDKSNDDSFEQFKKFKVIVKNKEIDLDWLSPNERKTLELVAEIFKYSSGREMTEVTHLRNSPWDKTIKEKGMGKPISYELAVDDESKIDIETAKEYLELQKKVFYNGRFQ